MIGCRFLPIIFTELRNDYFPTIYSKIENKSHHIPEYKLGNKDSVIPSFNQPSSSYSKVHTFSTIPNYLSGRQTKVQPTFETLFLVGQKDI